MRSNLVCHVHGFKTSSTILLLESFGVRYGEQHTFELAVRWHPSFWRWIKVNSTHKGRGIFIRYLSGPDTTSGSYIKNVLSILADGRAKKGVWCFAIENQMSKVEGFLSFKLLLIRGAEIFAVTKGLVTTTVLDVAGVDA